ncbi:hypothetical protein CHR90_02880 [Elstera cyanobacteriorum]|uniref:Nucleoside-diphosphate sugar epimerase n=1 Tax=Elstera cyanobacteriorum TaxID=2022747 RepID=A0A255XW88_9PROT|nr:hypothetical protein CHR90_02880 [Elstera cyanobacteriorum]
MPNSQPAPPPPSTETPTPLRVWIVSDDKAGTVNQARGLLDRLSLRLPVPPEVTEILAKARVPFRWLPARLWALLGPQTAVRGLQTPLTPPWPDLLIAAGRSAVAPAAAIRRLSRGRTCVVALQNPRLPLAAFDLVIAPIHDNLSAPNLLALDGAPHRVSAARLLDGARDCPPDLAAFYTEATAACAPIAAVLLGGNSARYRFDTETTDRLAGQFAALARAGVRLAITPSRRTPEDAILALRIALAPYRHYWWDGTPPNPYLALLALSDHLLVTADSVSMLSEAASTGKPVHRIDVPGDPGKFARFHARLEELGLVRRFDGTLPGFVPPPFDETDRAAEAVATLLKTRAGGSPRGEKSV